MYNNLNANRRKKNIQLLEEGNYHKQHIEGTLQCRKILDFMEHEIMS